MIVVTLTAEEATRSPGSSCYWLADCVVDGQTHTARGRRGAARELARLLVAAGIPDQPMRISSGNLVGVLTFASFHRAAQRTLRENAQTPLRSTPYYPPEDGVGDGRAPGLAAYSGNLTPEYPEAAKARVLEEV